MFKEEWIKTFNNSSKTFKCRENFPNHPEYLPDTKDFTKKKKKKSNISSEYRWENSQQDTNKLKSITYKKDYTLVIKQDLSQKCKVGLTSENQLT